MNRTMSRTTRAFRRNAATHNGSSVEFAELLDAIVTTTVHVSNPVVPAEVEPASSERATEVASDIASDVAVGTVEEPTQVSRFADAGLDDDRLPMRSTARHSRRR